MNILALDTSTDTTHIALRTQSGVTAHALAGGAATSTTLLPALLVMLQDANVTLAQLQAIALTSGPGAFTGLRAAFAVAKGLALPFGTPLIPVPTLLVIAQAAYAATGATTVQAVLDARMGEVYHATYARDAQGAWTLQSPAIAVARPADVPHQPHALPAGNAFGLYPELTRGGVHHPCLPDAASLLSICTADFMAFHQTDAGSALPLYVRDNVAQTTAERAAVAAEKRLANASPALTNGPAAAGAATTPSPT